MVTANVLGHGWCILNRIIISTEGNDFKIRFLYLLKFSLLKSEKGLMVVCDKWPLKGYLLLYLIVN